jgi:hypothetical protein
MADDSIGALWEKSKGDNDYFTGAIEVDGIKINIVVFKNKFKNNDRQPSWKIFKSKPKEQQADEMEAF